MARSPAKGSASVTEATTLIFPAKSTWEDLAKTKRETTKRAQSQTGMFGQAVKDAVEKKHIDRKALSIILNLDKLDDETLHVTVFHMIDGMKKLGILERAMAQEEMFETDKIDAKALDDVKAPKKTANGKKNTSNVVDMKGGKGKGRKRHPGVSGDELDGVRTIGEAARDVLESAGEGFKH